MELAAAAAVGGTAAAGTGSTLLSVLGAGLTVAQGVMGFIGSQQQAEQADLAANQEITRGIEEGNQVRERLLRTLAQQNAAYGASGVAGDSGSALNVRQASFSQADRELNTISGNARLRSLMRQYEGGQARSAGTVGLVGSGLQAGLGLIDYSQRRDRIYGGNRVGVTPGGGIA